MKHGSILGGALLVAGTTIGGGMLALPVLTSPGGFFPSLVIFVLCWLFMTLTGLLFLELSLHMKEGVNILSMANRTLGFWGKAFAWVLYLFMFYCLTVAYVVGCGDIVSTIFGERFSSGLGSIIFLILFAPFVYAGAKVVGKFNYLLMAALAFFYFSFIFIGFSEIKVENLLHTHWGLSVIALPVAFTSFAYQGIIPTLVSYMDRNAKKLRATIWLGTTIPLITYIIWSLLILGIIPFEGPNGLKEALANGHNAVYPLKDQLNHPAIFIIGQYFAFFALLTSFFGVTLGLFDFLADGLNIKKNTRGKIILSLLVFIPPLLIALLHPGVFLQALDYAGGYGSSLLLGLLPILMVAKYRQMHPDTIPQVGGGKLTLILLTLFVLFELAIEIYY